MDGVLQVARVVKEATGDLERILGKLEECYGVLSKKVEECSAVAVRMPLTLVENITRRSQCPIGFFIAAAIASNNADFLRELHNALDFVKVPMHGPEPRRVEDVWALYHLKTREPLSAGDAKIVLQYTFADALVESGLFMSNSLQWDQIVRYVQKAEPTRSVVASARWSDTQAYDLVQRVSVCWNPKERIALAHNEDKIEYDTEAIRAVRGMTICLARQGVEHKQAWLDEYFGKRKYPDREGYRLCDRVVELVYSERVEQLLRYVNVSCGYMERFIVRYQLYPQQVLAILREVEADYEEACTHMQVPMQTWMLRKRPIAKLMRDDDIPVKRTRTHK